MDLTPFSKCIDSLAKCLPTIPYEVEVVIADWESNDYPLKYWIQEVLPETDVHLITVKGKYFNHGKGKNIAAEYATGDMFFFLDADLILVPEVFTEGFKSLKCGEVFCPVFEYTLDQEGTKKDTAKRPGALLLTRSSFYKAGMWPEYKQWGFEDFAFIENLQKLYKVRFKKIKGFKHQWHPQSKEWKNQYTDPTAAEEHKQIAQNWVERIDREEQDILNGLNIISKRAIEKRKEADNIDGKDIPRIGDIWQR